MLVITPAVRELRRRHLRAEIGTRHLECNEERAFAEGRVDVLVARDPLSFPADAARMTVLYEEPRMLVVPAWIMTIALRIGVKASVGQHI
jgi:DNA-binding transcriptional LysR family regulator